MKSQVYLNEQFKKICIEGSGKGRIELAGSKYAFGYESQISKIKNIFELALDFPIIGETRVSLSLNPKVVSKQIGRTELIELLRQRIEDRADREQIIKTIEEFFVFASDFINYKNLGTYPVHFKATLKDDHFILTRETPHYIFNVDSFSDNQTYFERSIFKIFLKTQGYSDPIMTLFLVPQNCDSQKSDVSRKS